MGAKGSGEWKKLNREMKILQAKKKIGGLLPGEKERIQWLEERLGEAREVKRIRIDEQDDGGPKTLTTDDHYATEVGQDLLKEAGDHKATKAWDKDVQRGPRTKFEAADSRKGRATFQQKGLSPFAVDLTEDFHETGFADEPIEEDEGIDKEQQWARASYASEDEFDSGGQKSGGSDPFAVSMDAGLAGALGEFDNDSVVPDTAAKSFEADFEDDLDDGQPTDFTARIDDAPGEVQELFARDADEPEEEGALSLGEMTTHSAEEDEFADVDYDLMRAAMDYADEEDQGDETSETWAVDEQGREIEHQVDEDTFETSIPTGFEQAQPAGDDQGVLVPDPPPEQAGEPGADPSSDEFDLDEASADVVPDMSDGQEGEYEVNLWVEPEDDPPSEDGATNIEPEPQADDEFEFNEEMEVSEVDADDVPMPGPADGLDEFWGLVDEETDLSEAEPAAGDEPALTPEPSPEAPAQPPSSRPLPALNLEAVRVADPAPARPTPAQPPQPADQTRSSDLLSSLFGESPEPARPKPEPVPLEPIIIGPVKKARPTASQARHVAVGRGVTRQPATANNDLRGPRRATIHFRDGVSRRGTIGNIDTDSDTVQLDPVPGSNAPPEELTALALKAIFLLLPRGTAYPEKQGHYCKVMIVDNRTLEGYTPDYDPARKAFTLFPAQDRGNIERVIVYNDAVKNLWFPEE